MAAIVASAVGNRPYKNGLDTSVLGYDAVEEFPTANGPANYALSVDGKLLGIVEAKKMAKGPQSVMGQPGNY